MKNQTIYKLTVEDIQNVALQEIGRDLSTEEIEKIKNTIAEKVNWYNAIVEAITETININVEN